jgi:hypothetical protein
MLSQLMGSFILGLLGVSFISQDATVKTLTWFTLLGATLLLLGAMGLYKSLRDIGMIGGGDVDYYCSSEPIEEKEEEKEPYDKYHNPHIKSYQDAIRKLSFRAVEC